MPRGAIIQLAAYGEQDLNLTGNPKMTFFKAVYRRYTNFSMAVSEQYLIGNNDFGKRVYCELERKGDLVSDIELYVQLPSFDIPIFNDRDYLCSWTNSIGHAIINNIAIEIGGMIINRHYGQWLEIWDELTVPLDKRPAYNRLIGKPNTFLPISQRGSLNLYIPLRFWFNNNPGLALPLIALQENSVRLILEYNDFESLWISNTGQSPTTVFMADGSIKENPFHIQEAFFLVNYIYLDDEERRWFSQNNHTYLIEQLQINPPYSIPSNITELLIPLDNFNHPVKELFWVYQSNDVHLQQANYANDLFNFSAFPISGTVTDPQTEAQLKLESEDVFKIRRSEYFNVLQPYLWHTYTPNKFINVYSFSLDPEAYQPAGSINFARLDNVNMLVRLVSGMNNPNIIFYAVNYNFLSIKNGAAVLLYYS